MRIKSAEVQSLRKSPWITSNQALVSKVTTIIRTSPLCTDSKSTQSLKPKQELRKIRCRKVSHKILSIRRLEKLQETSSRLLRRCQRVRVGYRRRAHGWSFLSRRKHHGRKGMRIVAKCPTTGSLSKTPPVKTASSPPSHPNTSSSRIKTCRGMRRMRAI